MTKSQNVADRIAQHAIQRPDQVAIASPLGSSTQGANRPYRTLTFRELDQQSSSIAAGLQGMGMKPGDRIALLVRFGEEFITLVFALLKARVTLILIDPGMGRKNVLKCLEATRPDGFVAIPQAQVIRWLFRKRFPKAVKNVTVGNRWWILPSPSLDQLKQTPAERYVAVPTCNEDAAAIIFTTGSTGPPKGVLYTHGTFNHQIDQLVARYGIEPGGKDLSGFPLFGLFNAVMGTTTIIPDMDPTRPADVDPPRLLDAIDQWSIDQSFGSPALWNRVGTYCETTGRKIPSLKRILSAGAPVPPRVLQLVRDAVASDANMYTPYGATEALPVASIESREVLEETSHLHKQGKGTCVGSRFSGIHWKIIEITDGPLASIDDVRELQRGEIGELMVSGPVITRQYVTREDQNSLHKVADGEIVWHRMGDVGYLDAQDRFWFCGRKSHRVCTAEGVLFTEPIEALFNQHPCIYRSALVGIGIRDTQTPVVIVEPLPQHRPRSPHQEEQLTKELLEIARTNPLSSSISTILVYPKRLPTDIRHNSKIFREQLGPWAERMTT